MGPGVYHLICSRAFIYIHYSAPKKTSPRDSKFERLIELFLPSLFLAEERKFIDTRSRQGKEKENISYRCVEIRSIMFGVD